MNANELADWIKVTDFYEYTDDHYINDTMDEVEILLRQQQKKLTKYELRHAEQRKRIDEQQAEIEALKEVNTKQVDYIAEQKAAYEKLWKEHMELFWKHEKDVDEEQEK